MENIQIYMSKAQGRNTIYIPRGYRPHAYKYMIKVISPFTNKNTNEVEISFFPDFSSKQALIRMFKNRIQNPYDKNNEDMTAHDYLLSIPAKKYNAGKAAERELEVIVAMAHRAGLWPGNRIKLSSIDFVNERDMKDMKSREKLREILNGTVKVIDLMGRYETFFDEIYRRAIWIGDSEKRARREARRNGKNEKSH
jgi:hypothetical protein